MSDLPDLHGWLPARALARRLGVSPGTIRARAARGVLETIPNPIGPGALYREKASTDAGLSVSGDGVQRTAENHARGEIRGLGREDGLAFAYLPASASGIARLIGVAPGTADRCLHRLERAGLARPGGVGLSGPRGGRPEIIWRAVA